MAFYIEIVKIEDSKKYARYKYYTSESEFGIIRIMKDDGHMTEVKQMETDTNGLIFQRAAMALMKHWKKNEYPEKTYWAS